MTDKGAPPPSTPAPASSEAAACPALPAATPDPPFWRMMLSGLCAYLIGIGLARFAYTPLIPALVEGGWFTGSQAAYLGAANLAGYLVGALLSRRLATIAPTRTLLRLAMLVCAASFIACAWPAPFAWFVVWRAAAGFAGALLVVMAAPYVIAAIAAPRRGRAAGIIFSGPGTGIVAAGLVVPVLLSQSLAATWLGIGILSALLTLLAWNGWPAPAQQATAQPAGRGAAGAKAPDALPRTIAVLLTAIYAVYTLAAMGLVPHMLFLVDYVARGLGKGVSIGAMHWVLFGLGAMAGPLLIGTLGDAIGFRLTLRLSLFAQAAGVGALALTHHPAALAVSSIVIGAFIPGISVMTLGRIQELVDAPTAANAWRISTIGFAVGQAVAAYGLSYLFSFSHSYELIYAAGALCMVMAIAVDLAMDRRDRRDRDRHSGAA